MKFENIPTHFSGTSDFTSNYFRQINLILLYFLYKRRYEWGLFLKLTATSSEVDLALTVFTTKLYKKYKTVCC